MKVTTKAPGGRPPGSLDELFERGRRVHPRYDELSRKRHQLFDDIEKLEREIDALEPMVSHAIDADEDVSRVLEAGTIHAVDPPADFTEHAARHRRLEELERKRTVAYRAIAKIDSELKALQREADDELGALLRSFYYTGMVHDVAVRLVALGQAIEIETEFRLRAHSIALDGSRYRHCGFTAIGVPRDRYSAVARWLILAVDEGHIDAALIPAAWTEAWRSQGWPGLKQ